MDIPVDDEEEGGEDKGAGEVPSKVMCAGTQVGLGTVVRIYEGADDLTGCVARTGVVAVVVSAIAVAVVGAIAVVVGVVVTVGAEATVMGEVSVVGVKGWVWGC